MVAHANPALFSPDPGGVERRFARLMPSLVLGGVVLVGILWWMAAQPPPGPGWGGPQQQWPQGQQPNPQQGYPQQRPPQPVPQSSCGGCGDLDCSACAAGIDCADCASGCGDCGDCASGLDCGSCAVSGARAASGAGADAASGADASRASSGVMPSRSVGKSCSTSPWNRLAQSSGLLVPLFVLFAWRRRLPRRGIDAPDCVTGPAQT
jgi:hypothetical protein